MDDWMDGWVNAWMNGWLNAWMDARIEIWIHRRMDRWMNLSLGGSPNRQMLVTMRFARPIAMVRIVVSAQKFALRHKVQLRCQAVAINHWWVYGKE